MKYEGILRDFIKAVDTAQKENRFYAEKLSEYEGAQQDLLHQIEFGSWKDRDKWATKLAHIRQQRRYAKDKITLTEPIVLFAEENKAFIKKVEMVLGDVRKQTKLMKNRKYRPRVIKDLTMEGIAGEVGDAT